MSSTDRSWPPVPGDFTVKDPTHCVAVCTLGKKIDVPGNYAIIGTCKTENIGIERVVTNIISNSSIRFIIVAGPEVPGHLTGRSLKALYDNGVDAKTRRIVDAPGAIPYVENLPLEGIDRFREQVRMVEMINVSSPEKIEAKVRELEVQDPGAFPEPPIWFDFKSKAKPAVRVELRSTVSVLPEFGVNLDVSTFVISKDESKSLLAREPSPILVELRETDTGTILLAREG
ncbi:MAG: tetrahydromethanopterin S-methyltransferase subunit A [Candidatus Thorarchaeota archaeon]